MADPSFPTDDAGLRRAIEQADLASLLAALAYVTSDLELLREDLWLDPTVLTVPTGGWTGEQIELAEKLALDALRRYFASEPGTWSSDGALDIRRIVEWLSGTDLDDDYATMLIEELALSGDQRAPSWSAADMTSAAPRVVIIGAGMSGILAAHRLQQAGVPYTVLEKNQDVGGTWFENTYPGCRVDVFNHVYAYSGEQKADWPMYHSTQRDLLEYFRSCADRWNIRDHIRFGVHCESLEWDEPSSSWRVTVRDKGRRRVLEADAVVSAVGQLNKPLMPDIAGLDEFAGQAFHSSRWDHQLDLSGRRVAVIGTGASAMQFIPHVAEQAERVTVFQRTPPWLIPRPEYHEELPPGLLWLFEVLPTYARWFRLRLFWRTHEGAIDALRRDPEWTGSLEDAVSPRNHEIRVLLTSYLEHEFGDRPDLLAQVVPDYPVGAKRIVLDNGVWARTLHRPNVRLVSDSIDAIDASGVMTTAGEHIEADVLIHGTGFSASEFLTPMRVVGRDGMDLHDMWSGDARAYLGVTVPGFPNLFCLYGPNTNIVINGSIIYFSECEVHYVVESMRMLMQTGKSAMDCRRDVYDAYVERVDRRNGEMAWGISSVNSWYKSASGGVAQNWPFPLIDYWRQTRTPDPDDYQLT